MRYYIKTFGCQQNVADSERIASELKGRGMIKARSYRDADYIVINTCMVRESAENRVYGLVNNLSQVKSLKSQVKIIVTGCMVGIAFRDKTGKYLQRLKKIMPSVDEFMPIEEVGFDHVPVRSDRYSAWVPISNGCNNFCTFCVVPFTRGREISRPSDEIIQECRELKKKGYKKVMLLGQNVNSYGADLLVGENNIQAMRDIDNTYFKINPQSEFLNPKSPHVRDLTEAGKSQNPHNQNSKHNPVYVKHLGRYRIPTLFPHLLDEVAQMAFETVDFISSNPWDFSNELIEVIARNKNITRTIHLPVQSGDDGVLKRMNRWYTSEQYLVLISKIKNKISNICFTTDIIVGFCGESDEAFENTVQLCTAVGFQKAYISIYSERPMTAATKTFEDDVPYPIKKKRWMTLDTLINKKNHGSKKSI